MTTPIQTRVAENTDTAELAQLVRLNDLFNGASDSAEQIAARLADPHRVETLILAENDHHIIGFACLRLVPCILFVEPYAELTELFVEEGYRRQGAGRALVSHVEQLARQAGARQMLILTDYENHAALSLYRGLGYSDYDMALAKDLTNL